MDIIHFISFCLSFKAVKMLEYFNCKWRESYFSSTQKTEMDVFNWKLQGKVKNYLHSKRKRNGYGDIRSMSTTEEIVTEKLYIKDILISSNNEP